MTVKLQRSNGLLFYLVLIHALAVILLCLLNLDTLSTMLLGLLMLLSLLLSCRRYGWLYQQADIAHLRCDGDGRWFLHAEQTQTRPWQLQQSVQLGPLMVLRFSSSAKKHVQSVVVVRDAVDAIASCLEPIARLRTPMRT